MKLKNRYKPWTQIRERVYSKEVKLRVTMDAGPESIAVHIRKPLTCAPDEWVLIGVYYPWTARLFLNLARKFYPCSDLDLAIERCIDFLEETKVL